MRHFRTARRAALPAAAAVLGVLAAAPAAHADVTVSPTTAVQCSGDNIYFTVTNDGSQAIRTVQLTWPADTPVAEVYPLSVDDWAPRIDMQKLSRPLTAIHGGTPVTEAAKSITWFAVPGRELAPGKSTRVGVAIGPLPTVSTMNFAVATTYPDGKAGPTMPAQLALTPATDCRSATGHDGTHGGTVSGNTGGGTVSDDEYFATVVAEDSRGVSIWSIGGWVVAGLVLIGALVYFVRNRHRAEEDDDEPDTDEVAAEEPEREPVAAGSSKWSFKG